MSVPADEPATLDYHAPDPPAGGGLTATPWGRRLLFAGLYASEGAPVGFIWWFLATKLASAGVAGDRVSYLLALLLVPWTFKFLWAPAVDLLRGPRWGFRAWAASAQFVAGLAVLPMAWLDLRADFPLVFALALLHATAAATQDVAIDAWAVRAVPASERGRVTGWMQAGYRVAMWGYGYGLLLASGSVGRPAATVAVALAIWSSSALLLLCREPEGEGGTDVQGAAVRQGGTEDGCHGLGTPNPCLGSTARVESTIPVAPSLFASLSNVLSRPATWLGLGVALLAGAAFESVGGLLGPFLIGRGFAESTVGLIGTCSVLGLVPGGLLGGWLADRLGRRLTLAATVLAIGYAVVSLCYLDRLAPAPWPHGITVAAVALLFAVYAGVGVLTASSYALFMDLSGTSDEAGTYDIADATTPDAAALGGTQFRSRLHGRDQRLRGLERRRRRLPLRPAGLRAGLRPRRRRVVARPAAGTGGTSPSHAGASLLALPLVAALRPSTQRTPPE